MLKQMRANFQHLKLILIGIIIIFLYGFVWGIAGRGKQARATQDFAAKVDGHVVTTAEFQSAVERQDRYLRQILGEQYKPQFLNARSVLDGLVERRLLLGEADRMGLVVTPQQVADEIQSFKGLKDESGNFNRQLYDEYLQGSRQRPAEFEEQVADDLRLGALDSVLRGGTTIAESELKDKWLEANESASIEYVVFPLADSDSHAVVTDQDTKAWFDAHSADFDAGPARKVKWVHFSREDIQKGLEKEDELRKYYDENVEAIYTLGEGQRRASLVLITVPPGATTAQKADAKKRAEAAAGKARSGADFAQLVASTSDDAATKEAGGDLGPFYQGTREAAVDKAIFAAREGDIVGPIETSRGFEVLKVTKGPGTKARPFEDVRSLVARGLYARPAAEALQEAVKKFQSAYAAKPDFDAAAEASGLKASEPTWITKDGEIPGLGRNPIVAAEALRLDVGAVSEPLSEPGGQVILAVLEKRDSSPRTFEEAKADVEKVVRTQKARELAKVDAEALRAAAASATSLADVAGGRSVQTAGPLTRKSQVKDLPGATDVVKAAFETEQGKVGRVADAADGEVVFRVTERKAFDEAAFAAGRQALERRLEDQRFQALRQGVVSQLKKSHEAEIILNEKVLAPFEAPAPS